MNQDTFLILKLLITFLKELVVGQWSFSAKCTGLFVEFHHSHRFDRSLFRVVQRCPLYKEIWLPWQPKGSTLKSCQEMVQTVFGKPSTKIVQIF